MLKIRLTRIGSKKQPYYRVVVAEERSRRDSQFVEILGHYNPRHATSSGVDLNLERVHHWIGRGAMPTETVRSLIRKSVRRASVQSSSTESSSTV